jgi:hypothetical protein
MWQYAARMASSVPGGTCAAGGSASTADRTAASASTMDPAPPGPDRMGTASPALKLPLAKPARVPGPPPKLPPPALKLPPPPPLLALPPLDAGHGADAPLALPPLAAGPQPRLIADCTWGSRAPASTARLSARSRAARAAFSAASPCACACLAATSASR